MLFDDFEIYYFDIFVKPENFELYSSITPNKRSFLSIRLTHLHYLNEEVILTVASYIFIFFFEMLEPSSTITLYPPMIFRIKLAWLVEHHSSYRNVSVYSI